MSLCEQVVTKRLLIRTEPSVLGCRLRGFQTASCKAKVETTSGAIRIGKSWRLPGSHPKKPVSILVDQPSLITNYHGGPHRRAGTAPYYVLHGIGYCTGLSNIPCTLLRHSSRSSVKTLCWLTTPLVFKCRVRPQPVFDGASHNVPRTKKPTAF